MKRGTTPTVLLKVTSGDGESCDLTSFRIFVTFEGTDSKITKEGEDISVSVVEDHTELTIKLTQEETLSFRNGDRVRVQLRCVDDEGNALASNIGSFHADEILLEGVI